MKYKIYTFNWDAASVVEIQKPNEEFANLNNLLGEIQDEIVRIYTEIQTKNYGVKKLGNDMRYDDKLNSLFENPKLDYLIVKLTENKRYFLKKFIDSCSMQNKKGIFFFILEKSFGKQSNLVDNSFLTIHDVRNELTLCAQNFAPQKKTPKFYFIEVIEFTDYYFSESNDFVYIHKTKK
jgi:hypothetical protein